MGGVTNLWIADVKAVRESHADMLKALPLDEAWLRCGAFPLWPPSAAQP